MREDNSKPTLAIVLSSDFESGGGHSYENSVLSIIQDFVNAHLIVYSTSRTSDPVLGNHIQLRKYRISKLDSIRRQFLSRFHFLPNISRRRFLYSSLEQRMIRDGVTIAYLLSPNPITSIFQEIPMINTVWDIGHRTLLEYPELRSLQIYRNRENYLRETLPRSLHVFTDSEFTKEQLSSIYGLSPTRITPLGLFPRVSMPLVEVAALQKVNQIIYPANFWPHKNHELLFKAMQKVVEQRECKLILTSSGTQFSHETLALMREKYSDVVFEHHVGLSRKSLEKKIAESKVLAMPSSLGPTNLPPLEALMLGTKVVVSDAHKDQKLISNPNVRVVDPYDSEQFAMAIIEFIDNPKFISTGEVGEESKLKLFNVLISVLNRVH